MAQLKNIIVEGDSRLIGDVNANKITASSFVNPNGTSDDFLKADGSLDDTPYLKPQEVEILTDQQFIQRACPTTADTETAAIIGIKGASGKWNQLVEDKRMEISNATLTYADHYTTAVLTNGTTQVRMSAGYPQRGFKPNDKVLCVAYHKEYSVANAPLSSVKVQTIYNLTKAGGASKSTTVYSNGNIVAGLFTIADNVAYTDNIGFYYDVNNTNSFAHTTADKIVVAYNIHNLTAIYGAGNEPTIEEFFGKYGAYYKNYSAHTIINFNPYQLRTTGVNVWDEEWVHGRYNTDTGEAVENASMVRNKNRISIIPNSTYYVAQPGASGLYLYLYFYDAEGNFIGNIEGIVPNRTFTPTAGAAFMNFFYYKAGGLTTMPATSFNLSDPAINGTYEAYTGRVIDFPQNPDFPDGYARMGDVYDEEGPFESVERIKKVDLYRLAWAKNGSSSTGGCYCSEIISHGWDPSASKTDIIFTPDKYTANGQAYNQGTPAGNYICLGPDRIYISDLTITNLTDFVKTLQNHKLYCKYKEPIVRKTPYCLPYRIKKGGIEEIIQSNPAAPKGSVDIQYGLTAPQITDGNSSTYAITKNDLLQSAGEVIIGTQTVATNKWTGVSKLATASDFKSGYRFTYWLPWAGNGSSVDLTLTFQDGTTKNILLYFGGTARLTTHFGAGNKMDLTYLENVSIAGATTLLTGAWVDRGYDSNTYYQLADFYVNYRISSASAPLYRYKLVGFDANGAILPLVITDQTNSIIVDKTPISLPLSVSRGIYLYNTSTNITATTDYAAAATLYSAINTNTISYTFNDNLPNYNEVFLKGTYDATADTFTLDTTTHKSWYVYAPYSGTTVQYNAVFTEGAYYWKLGRNYNNGNYWQLTQDKPLYIFKGGKLIPAQNYENSVFVAQYGVTTFDELSSAYNAGKSVFVKMTNWYPSPWYIGRADDGFDGSVPLIEIALGEAHFGTLVYANNDDVNKNGVCRIDAICDEGSTWSRDINEAYTYTSPRQSEIDSLFDEPTPTPGSSSQGGGGYTPGTDEVVFAGFVMGQTQSGAAGEILYGDGTNYNSIKNDDCTLMDTNGQRLSYTTIGSTEDSVYITLTNGGELLIDMSQQGIWEYTE